MKRMWTRLRPKRPQVWLLFMIYLGLLSTACAYNLRIRPLPSTERLPLRIDAEDLTGTGADSLFAAALHDCLLGDYIYVLHSKRPTQSNEGLELIVAQNPFRPTAPKEDPDVVARADIERADYGSASVLEDASTGRAFFGHGAEEIGISDVECVAILQLRFDPAKARVGESNIVHVARFGKIREISRRRLVDLATQDAVHVILMDLARSERAKGHLKMKEQVYPSLGEYDARDRLYKWTRIIAQ